MSQAEEKPLKFGETLTRDGDGNPELSSESRESVETRREGCLKCGGVIDRSGRQGRRKKFCSSKCRQAYGSWRHRVATGKIKKAGVGSGGNQNRENNHQWKGGTGTYRTLAFEHYPHYCNRCGSKRNLEVHHRNHNQRNNKIENLEILCKSCHRKHHTLRDDKGRFTNNKG